MWRCTPVPPRSSMTRSPRPAGLPGVPARWMVTWPGWPLELADRPVAGGRGLRGGESRRVEGDRALAADHVASRPRHRPWRAVRPRLVVPAADRGADRRRTVFGGPGDCGDAAR